jgi:penicillin-binding protein 1B
LRCTPTRSTSGQRGSFSINGFGEAAQAYFGKDVRQLDLAECALLAGIIQRPNYFNPFRHADRTIERRNLVLDSMVETGAITKEQAERAKAEPLHLSEASVDASEAPYFVDLVHEQLSKSSASATSTAKACAFTLRSIPTCSAPPPRRRLHHSRVDEQVDRHTRKHKPGETWGYPQVALVALNPHTGQVLALVGGRNYGARS